MAKLPTIANVSCSRLKFEAGDRILVRTTRRLDKDQESKLRHHIQKWAGVEVEVLIYCVLDMDINVEKK